MTTVMMSYATFGQQRVPMHRASTRSVVQRSPIFVKPSRPFPRPCAAGGGGNAGGNGNGGEGNGNGGGGGGSEQNSGPGLLGLVTALYAVLVVVAGGMAYNKRGSKQSLVTAATAGACIMGGVALGTAPGLQRIGLVWAAGSCAGLATVMGKRWASSRSFVPAGAVATSAALLGLANLSAVF